MAVRATKRMGAHALAHAGHVNGTPAVTVGLIEYVRNGLGVSVGASSVA